MDCFYVEGWSNAMDTRRLRSQLRSARRTARWVRDNPWVVRDLARGLLPADSTEQYVGERVVPAGLSGYDRTVSVSATTSASPQQVRAVFDDLSRLPEWMTIHAGWRGTPPTEAELGATFTEQVKLMGIPADISWTVDAVDETSVAIRGTGPMGLTIANWFAAVPDGTGSRILLDAGLGGDPVRGPMGGSVAKSVADEMTKSLAALTALLDSGAADAAPVLHHASGRRLDPATPVIVGVGQVVQHEPDPGKDPVALAVEALRSAESDAGVAGLLGSADAVYAVASASWTYRDAAALVAERLGAKPATTVQSARFGGDAGQVLINAAGEAIASGDASVVLVCGAEAGASLAASPETPRWPEQGPDVKPSRVVGSEREANNRAEADAGLIAPIHVYALMESALRGKLGLSRDAHRQRIAGLWSRLSEVAAQNRFAWLPRAFTPAELGMPGDDNRMVATPYTKLLCANLQVDLASGLILTSVAAAAAAGVPQDKWVFLHAGAAAYDEWFVSERGDLAASPAIRTIGRAALEHAGITIDDVAHVDLYSCFPVAVQIAAMELGLSLDRPLSVTGGLTFAGGPGNNYGGHAVATLVQRLREDRASFGLSTSLGWYVTKHALGIYSAQPPTARYRALAPVVDTVPTRPALTSYTGPGVIEAYTVVHDRTGPEAAIVSVVTPEGARVLVRTAPTAAFVDDDPLGWKVEVADGDLTVTTRRRSAVPPPPEPTVLVDDRGPVRVITLNRPERRNAIDLPTAQLLERVIDAFEADPTARVAVLTGAGGSFCAGMDLKAAATGQFAMTERRGPLGIAAVPISKPVIAAVEGHALAGGCELALVADLIVAASDAEFGIPEPKRGLVAAAGGVLRLAQRLPRNVAMELALTGDPMPATRLAELGLVNRLADPGNVLDVAVELAEQIVGNAPLSVEASRRIVLESQDWSREEAFDKQTEIATPAVLSEDAGEGVRAFAEKRQPRWSGR